MLYIVCMGAKPLCNIIVAPNNGGGEGVRGSCAVATAFRLPTTAKSNHKLLWDIANPPLLFFVTQLHASTLDIVHDVTQVRVRKQCKFIVRWTGMLPVTPEDI